MGLEESEHGEEDGEGRTGLMVCSWTCGWEMEMRGGSKHVDANPNVMRAS